MTTREVIAANVRARLAWAGMSHKELQLAMGWSARTTHNKLYGDTALTAEEISTVARHLGTEPGALFEIPEGFSSPSASSKTALAA